MSFESLQLETSPSASDPETPNTEYSAEELTDHVAVVGMGCRVAGGNNNPEQLWQSLLSQKDASGTIPAMRWAPYHQRDPRNPKIMKQISPRGYFLDNLFDFDCQFFGISPKEAEQMDPQQRISLEVAWEALEDAGITAKELGSTDTAVFWGVNSDDFSKHVLEDLPNVDAWMGIGTAYCGVPNRISHHLNLMGPSVAVDAACASSLVAVHNGVQSVLADESTVAIVGGVNALCGPGLTRVLDKAGATSPEGRCHSFDDDAHGYGRGEGTGAVILKRLSRAMQDGDHIQAIIKGSAVAHDGKTNGIMAPNANSQKLVAGNALKMGRIDPMSVRYVEAHATSTPLGDPTEVSAISGVYGKGREVNNPCFIGSIKPNIGHLEAGAGVMGLIKTVMAVQKAILPPQTNLQKLNTRVDWAKSGVKVVQEQTDWPECDSVRRAAVCSYGYGGTVSHVVIEQSPSLAPDSPAEIVSPVTDTARILLVSAPQEKRLPIHASLLKKWILSDGSQHDLASICTTLAVRRDHHDCRAALIVEDHESSVQALDNLSNGKNDTSVIQGRILGSDVSKDVVWVFSGHGAQWNNMGKELIHNPTFCQAIQPLDDIVRKEIGLSPIEWLRNGDFESSDRVQILTYIMHIGISSLLHEHGIFPHAVIGHSIGEVAASVVAGALSPEDGMLVVTRRAVLYRQVMGKGAMILVNKPFDEVTQEIAGNSDVVVAIHSSPSSCVVAGVKDAIASVAEDFRRREVKIFTVKTDIAFHSPLLEQLVEPMLGALEGTLSPTTPATKLYSTSSVDPRAEDQRDEKYWVNNMVNPVRFTSAVRAATDDGYRVFMEISSHPIISNSLTETILDCEIDDYAVIPVLKRDQATQISILRSLANLHCSGVEIDWRLQMPGTWAGKMPTTPWMHRHTWREVDTPPANSAMFHDVEQHTLLGQRIAVAGTETVIYTTELSNDTKPFPGSHPLFGTEIVPAAGLINTFLKGTEACMLQNIALRVPVAINAPRTVQLIVQSNQVRLMSRLLQSEGGDDSSWVTHTTSNWKDQKDTVLSESIDVPAVRKRIGKRLPDAFSIEYLAKVGVSAMGFPWAVLEHYGNAEEMIARVDTAPDSQDVTWDPSSWAPILNSATSIGSTIFGDPRLRMPAQIGQVEALPGQLPPKVGWLFVQKASDTPPTVDVSVLNDKGEVLAKITSMRFSEIEGTPGLSGSMESLVHQLSWPPVTPAEEPIPIRQIVMIGKESSAMSEYTNSIPDDIEHLRVTTAKELTGVEEGTVIVYVPGEVKSLEDVSADADSFTWDLLEITKFAIRASISTKVFVLGSHTGEAQTLTALAHAPLQGLSRIIANEHPDIFGGFIDSDAPTIPLATMKYIQSADIIRIRDGIARTARLRPLPRRQQTGQQSKMLPRPEGTYLITGGLGALGLAVADFLAEYGARRIVLISRRAFPSRSTWKAVTGDRAQTVSRLLELERRGVTVHVLSMDICDPNAATAISGALDRLSLPPVLGVVHAAGVLEDQLVRNTTRDAFGRVLAPKINGALSLHSAFPPGALDFFILFSSCGGLFGFPGQSSYASGNAFLDALATHRRGLGDNAIAFQWTTWRGMGMGVSTEVMDAELDSRGITDVTRDEAFGAWLHLSRYDLDHGVVLRSRAFDAGEPLPTPLLQDIAVRRARTVSDNTDNSSGSSGEIPAGVDLNTYLDEKIRECVADVLYLAPDEIDSKTALADLGVDSVLTVNLRRQFQQKLKVKVPPTLIWSHPTVSHLVGWFQGKMSK